MSNCCMRRPAKFHVDSAVRFWAIANIREGGRQTPPPGQARVKHNHEDSFVGGRISVVSPVAGIRDWRDPAERWLSTSSRDIGSGGGGRGVAEGTASP